MELIIKNFSGDKDTLLKLLQTGMQIVSFQEDDDNEGGTIYKVVVEKKERNVTEKQIEITNMLNHNLPVQEIAQKANCSKKYVYALKRRLEGTDIKKTRLTPEQKLSIIDEFEKGANKSLLAKKYNVSRATILRIVTKN